MPPKPRAAIYCRISLARDDDTKGVDRQEADCRKLAQQRGWKVAAVHVDNSRSAWQRNRKRPGWDALLGGITADSYDAVVVYHGDRLIRQSEDLEVLLRLATDKGIRLASILGDRDLDNHDDRYILRIEAAGHTRESDSTSRRMRRALADKAAAGLPHATGRRPFGYTPDGLDLDPLEAPVVAELAARILAGESVTALCRDLDDRGIRTSQGNQWTHGAMSKMLARPRHAGLRQHNDDALVPAVWPPTLERDTWEAVRAALTEKAGAYSYATNTRAHLLSGIARCGNCGAPLAIRHNTRPNLTGYGCINRDCPGRVHRRATYLDAYVIGAVLERLADPRLWAPVAAPDHAGLGTRLTALEARRRSVVREFAASTVLTTADLEATVADLDAQTAGIRERLAGATRAPVLDGLAGLDRAGWDDLPLARRRAVVGALVTVTVHRGKRGPGFDASAVDVRPV